MKKFFKRLILPLNIILIAGICIYCIMFAIKKANDYQIYTKPEIETKIYTVWHCETFEGGGKSRLPYLKNIAREIEKENAGVLIMIKTIDPAILESELKETTPDVISFGFGVGSVILPKLSPIEKTYDVRDELVISGSFNNKVYALPYIVSGYAMIKHSAEYSAFHCGENEYIKPSNIYNKLNLQPVEKESQYEAYKDFVYDKKVALLGSGRDVFRVNNLNNIGRTTAMISPIDSYTDLIQYLGLIKNDEITNKFLNYCLDDEHQNKLTEYSLFSSKYQKLYYTDIYCEMEDAIYRCSIPKVFYA